MSYHVARPRRISRRRPAPVPPYPTYPLFPLAQVQQTEPKHRALIMGIVIVIALMLFLSWLGSETKERVRDKPDERVRKMSTGQLAQNLHDRLERRGHSNETTMRSLKRYASKR